VPGVNPYCTAPKVVPGVAAANPNQVMVVELLNSMISVLFQRTITRIEYPNHGLTSKKKKRKQSKLDKLAKPDLPLEAKQKLLENPQLLN
jgi:hypothetical protein